VARYSCDSGMKVMHRSIFCPFALLLMQSTGANDMRGLEIVVTDIALPDLNRFELSKRIRAARPETKLLFVTGFGDQFPELRE
jgi:DNA-binding response OmpR family regulator